MTINSFSDGSQATSSLLLASLSPFLADLLLDVLVVVMMITVAVFDISRSFIFVMDNWT